MNCIDCGHALRPRNVRAGDAPGTRKEQPGPRCPRCYASAPKRGKARAESCTGCERPLRPAGVTLREMPGTVTHRSSGQCVSCWRLEKGVTAYRKDTRPKCCKDCGVGLRPNHADPEAYPGAIRHAGKGICVRCKSKADAAARAKPKPKPVTPLELAPVVVEPAVIPEPPREEPLPHIDDPAVRRFHAERAERRRRLERGLQVRAAQEAARARFIASRRAA